MELSGTINRSITLSGSMIARGLDGRGIVSIAKTGTSGLVDTYTITYTDETTSTFTVTNGANGQITATSFAEEFSSSKAYAVGDYVVYSGQLYQFTTAHAAGAWNASHATAVQIADQVSELKSALNETITVDWWNLVRGYKILEATAINGTSVISNASQFSIDGEIPAEAGKTYYAYCDGNASFSTVGARFVNFLNSNKELISTLNSGSDNTRTFTAPENTAYITITFTYASGEKGTYYITEKPENERYNVFNTNGNKYQLKDVYEFLNPVLFGGVADGLTDCTNNVQSAINACNGEQGVIIPPRMIWHSDEITFANNVPVIDVSGCARYWDNTSSEYKYTLSGRVNLFLKTDSPGSKDADGFVVSSDHHPWIGVNGKTPNGYASYQLGVDGTNKASLMIEPYTQSETDYTLISLRNNKNGNSLGIVQVLGGDNGNNEIGINRVPAKNIDIAYGTRLTGRDLVHQYYAPYAQSVVFYFLSNNKTRWTQTYHYDGRLIFTSLHPDASNPHSITFMNDGRIKQEYRQGSGEPTALSPNWIGEEYFDTSSKDWYKAVGTSAGEWKKITI